MNTIVMTGATAGIGLVARQYIETYEPSASLLVGARKPGSSGETRPLDLASLQSVNHFADDVIHQIGNGFIHGLMLNAGVSFPNIKERSEDGFETTFAVNHLGHFLLLQRLLPHLHKHARVVFTTSSTHDPEEHTILPPPHHASAEWLAYPERDPQLDANPRTAGSRAYCASKLCNILTARALARRDPDRCIIALAPGPTPGTGLMRQQSAAVRAVWAILGTALGRLRPTLTRLDRAGEILADLTLGRTTPGPGQLYAVLRGETLTWQEPSALARRDDVADKLWADSARLVGLSESSLTLNKV